MIGAAQLPAAFSRDIRVLLGCEFQRGRAAEIESWLAFARRRPHVLSAEFDLDQVEFGRGSSGKKVT